MVTPLAPIALVLLAVQAEPSSPARADGVAELRALFAEAVRLQQARELDAAADAYGRFLQAQPRNVEALSNVGAVLAAQGRYEDAIERYREALGVDPARTAVRLNLALALEKAGRPADAATELERVVAEAPQNRNAIVLLADCRVQLAEYDRAVALLTPLHEKSPDDRAVTFLLGFSLLEDNQVDRGKLLLDRVLRDGESAETRLLMGAVKLGAREYVPARDDLRRAAELNPALPMVHVLLGRALMNTGDVRTAAEEFRRELAARPNDFDANLFLGVLLKQDNALDEAMARFEKAAVLRPGDPAALYQVGSLRLQRGDADGSREVLERVVAAAPDFVEAHVSLALVYYRLKRKADGDRERDIVRDLERTRQAEQPGAKAGGEVYRGEPRLPAPAKKDPRHP
jgi:tetratricopeptide (TPR) repeat protein